MSGLNETERQILIGIHREQQRLSQRDDSMLGYTGNARTLAALRRHRTWRARAGWIRPRPSRWLGEPNSPKVRKRASRAYAKLEAMGHVIRDYGPTGLATELNLTEGGRELADKITNTAADESLVDGCQY